MAEKVIVVDTDRTSLELITAVLTRDGFDVLATPDGEDALARFFESDPVLVVCAITLPGLSGTELCQKIKEHRAQTRVVLLDCDGRLQGMAGELDCDAVLTTPLSSARLKELLRDWSILAPPDVTQTETAERFVMPPPVALPQDLTPITAPQKAPERDDTALPPLPVPIPLPCDDRAGLPAEELPELNLDEVAEEELVEIVAEEVLVPQRPKVAYELDIPGRGGLTKYPVPRLLHKLYLATFSGALHLHTAAAHRTLFFWGGIPVRVDSRQVSEALGRMLLEHGRITVDQYTESLEVMKSRDCRQGEALLELGAISQSDLLDALRQQTELKLTNTFAWRTGTYIIEPGTDFAQDSVLSEVHPLQAIWRGVHEHYDLDSLLSFFVDIESHYIVATDLFPVHFETLGPFLRELGAARYLDGKTTFASVLQADSRTLLWAQALYVLLVTDMIVSSQTPGAPAEFPATPSTAVSRIAADPAEISRLSDEIAREYLRIKESDLLDVLRVDLSSTPQEVDAAFANIVGSLRLDNLPLGLPEEVNKRARQIREVLNKARTIVRDPQLRDRYLAEQQERFAAAAQPAVPAVKGEPEGPPPEPQALELDVFSGRAVSIEAEHAFSAGQEAMRRERFYEAAIRFKEAIEYCRDEPTYRVALGRALLAASGPSDETTRQHVVTCLQQALEIDPSHLEANLEMGKLLASIGNHERAGAYVRRVLQRQPTHQEARRLLASLG